MAGSSFQEVLRLVIEAGGQGDVDLLIKQLDALEKVSATGSKEALALSAKLKELAGTAAQINAYTRLKGEITETNTAIAAESEKLVKLNADLAAAEKPSAALEKTIARSKSTLESLLTTQNKQSVELQKTAGALTKAGVDTTHLADAQGKLSGEIDTTTKHLGAVTTESGKAAGGVGKLEAASTSAADKVSHLALQLTGVVLAVEAARKTLEIGFDFAKDGVADAAALEDAFAQVKAVTGATADEMERLKAAVEVATQTTKFNSLESAQGLLALARASGNANDAARELVPTLNLAQAANIAVADSATLLVQVLAEFRLGAESASHVSDLLAQGAKSGGIGLQGLADGLQKTAPLAARLNITADQTVAILSALASEGVRGRLAAGGLKDAFEQLSDPFSAFSTRLQEMGITTRDFNEVIAELAKRPAQAQQALEALSQNARPAIELLVADGGAKIRQLQGDLENSGGAAAKAAKEMEDSFSGASDALGKSYDELKETLFAPVLIPLRDAVGDLSKDLDAFAKSKDFDEIKVALKDTFGEGAKAVHDFISTANFHELAVQIKSFVGEAKTDIASFRENLAGLIETIKIVYEAFKFAFHVIEAAILLVVTAVAELVRGMAALQAKLVEIENFDPTGLRHKFGLVSDEAVRTAESIADGATYAATALQGKLGDAIDDASTNFDALTDAVTSASDGASKALAITTAATKSTAEALEKTADAGHDAAGGIDAATTAAQALTPAQQQAKQAADQLTSALHLLGITTQADLQTKADAAANAYALVVQQFRAGKLAIEDVRRSYLAYAEAQRAAVSSSDAWKKEQVETQLAVMAAVSGVTSEFDGLGEHAEHATERIVVGAGRAVVALKEAAANTDAFAESTKDLDALMRNADGSINATAFSFGAVSEAATEAYEKTNEYAEASQYEWRTAINAITAEVQRERDALKGLSDELDKQLAKADPLADKIAALKAQYKYADDASLRAVAEKQQQAEAATQAALDAQVASYRANRPTTAPASPPPGAAHPNTNPNLGSGNPSGGRDSTFTIKLDLPSGASQHKLSADQLQSLIPQILEQIKRELETTFR